MTCPGRGEAISAHLDQALDEPQREALEAHLATCADCRAEHEALAQVRAQVQALPRLSVPGHFTAQVMAAVLEAQATESSESGCGELAEDLSATIDDGVLTDATAARIQAHLTTCPACQAEQGQLRRLRATLQRLPRLTVPAGFLERVLAAVEAVEADKVTRLEEVRTRRLAWWGRLGGFAQAAGLLLLVGAGSFLSAPGAAPMSTYGYRAPAPLAGFAQRNAAQADKAALAPEPAPLPGGPYAAVLELDSGGSFDEARAALQAAVGRYARGTEGQLQTKGFQGYVVQVPANLTDDLLRELDASPAVRPDRDAEAEVERISTELDTVALKSGHVFAGRVNRRGRTIELTVGETRLSFPAAEVEAITPADAPRRLRLELRAQD